jgi:anti-sigma regulatory factor (Ser/Thr protein kinase)
MARNAFDETRAGRGSLVLTEAATNILKHAGEGVLLIRSIACGTERGVEVIALDKGPGIGDWSRSTTDGYSTGGSPGTGLGAMQRLSDEFDAYSRSALGTAVRMTLWSRDATRPHRYELGAICAPLKGEPVCGDAWGLVMQPEGVTLLVADGLGHGLQAHEASEAAVAVLERYPEDPASRVLETAHGALRSTRGAAVAVARCDFARREVAFAAAGNIAAVLIGEDGKRYPMMSHNGIVGHKIHSMRSLGYAWPDGAILVMHSDGIETQWDLGKYPGIIERHPALIAGVLYRDHARARDDATVVVLKPGRASPAEGVQ